MIHHILYMVNLSTLPLPYPCLTPFLPLKMGRLIAVLPFLPTLRTTNTYIHVYVYTRFIGLIASRYVALVHRGKKGKKGKNGSTNNVFNLLKRGKAGVRKVRFTDLQLYTTTSIRQVSA